MRSIPFLAGLGCAVVTLLAATAPHAAAAEPADWWASWLAVDPSWQGRDDAPATVGQLQWMALKAHEELNARLIGGAGFPLPSFAENGNARVATTGEGRQMAGPYWARLEAVSAELTRRELEKNFPGWEEQVPWLVVEDTESAGESQSDRTILTVGALKSLFCYCTRSDEDRDGLTDWQEWQIGGDIIGAEPEEDVDGDGQSNLVEVTFGTDPLDEEDNPLARLKDRSGDSESDELSPGQAEVFTPLMKADSAEPRSVFGRRQEVPAEILIREGQSASSQGQE